MRGSQYNDDVNLYTRSNGVTCYTTSPYTADKLYVYAGGVYREFSGTLYTRSNGATRYSTSRVDTPLYVDAGSETVTVIREEYDGTLYRAGTRTSIMEQGDLYDGTVFNQDPNSYPGGLYYNPKLATISTREVTALTV